MMNTGRGSGLWVRGVVCAVLAAVAVVCGCRSTPVAIGDEGEGRGLASGFEPVVSYHHRKWGQSIERVRFVVDERLFCIEIRRPIIGFIGSDPAAVRVLYSTDDVVRVEAYRSLRRSASLLVADAGLNGEASFEHYGNYTRLALPDLGIEAMTPGARPFAVVLMIGLDTPNAVALEAALLSEADFEHYDDAGWDVSPAQRVRETLEGIEAAHSELLFELLGGGELEPVVALLLAFDNACLAD